MTAVPRPRRSLAWVFAGLTVAACVAALLLGLPAVKPLLYALLFVVPGVLVASGRPSNPLGWLLLAVAIGFASIAAGTAWLHHQVAKGSDDAAAWAAWYVDRGSAFVIPCLLASLLLVPDGRLPSRGWRVVAAVVLGAQVAVITLLVFSSGQAAADDSDLPGVSGWTNPVGFLPAAAGRLADRLEWIAVLPLLLAVAAVVTRLRRNDGDERQRLASVLAAVVVFVLLSVAGSALWGPVAEALNLAAAAILSAALTSAVLTRRLAGVDVAVHHALAYATLTAAIAGGYVLVVGLLTRGGDDLPPLGVGIVAGSLALALLPARGYLQSVLDQAMRGDVRDPTQAVRRLTGTVAGLSTVEALLPGIARSIRSSLRASWASVTTATATAEQGSRPIGGRTHVAALSVSDTSLGRIEVAFVPGRRFGAAEDALLTELADHAARVLHAIDLAEELHRSRQLLVAAREDERLRLRRDLHDDLGPTLASLAMQLAGLQTLICSDPTTAAHRVPHLEVAARRALDDVRRLSRGLRPPALDELGLIGALRDLAERAEIDLTVCSDSACSDDTGSLAPAVEVAAYRIAAEALTNAARHSGSRDAHLRLASVDGRLRVSVADRGHGMNGVRPGVGLLSMRERAEELGGLLTIESCEEGTTITAELPLTAEVRR